MDKETIALIDDVRKSLVAYGKTQKGSAQKKTRKITSQLIWDPSPYLDELDNIKSTAKTEQEVIERTRKLIRSSEEAALKSMTLLPDDTGHHIIQSRTGGDALTELPYKRTGPIIERLSAKHQQRFGNSTGPGGNLPAEMSLSNYSHKADDRATGLERQSGIGKNPDKATTAHNKGTAAYANMKGVDLADDAAIETNLSSKITEQQQAAKTAAATDAPRQAAIREQVPGAYTGTADDVAKAKKVVTPKLVTDRDFILNAYRKLTKVPGGKSFLSAIPVVGLGFGVLEAGERSAKAAETKDPADAAQATLATGGLIPGAGILPDAANVVMDMYRNYGSHNKVRGRSGAKRAQEAPQQP